jgi:hypothetical protein
VHARRFGLFRVRSPLLAESLTCFLLLEVLRWFTSLRCPRTAYGFSCGSPGISQGGFPHSEIPGSKLICSSPGLIAAYRVLHRLLAPRHSPYALSSLTTSVSSSRCRTPLRDAYATPARSSITACDYQKRTTVCRIFSCQRARKSRGSSPQPFSLTRLPW